MSRFKSILSRLLTVIIIFLVAICVILFFKIVTNSDVSIGGIRFYYVATESMYPTIKPHAMMVVKETDPEKLEVGDIISFVSRDPAIYGMVNTHRIYEITEDNGELAFVTMGDHNPTPDSLLVYPDEIKGKVIFYTPPMKGLTSFLSFAGTQMGFFIVILMPLMLVAGMFFGSFIKEFQASLRRETEELEALRAQKQQELEAQKEQEAREERRRLTGNDFKLKKLEAEAQMEEVFGMDQQKISVPTSELPKEVAEAILERFFGKKISEITEEDITKKLAKCDTSVKNNGIIKDNKNDVSKKIVESERTEQDVREADDATKMADAQEKIEAEDTVKFQSESNAQNKKEAGDGEQ